MPKRTNPFQQLVHLIEHQLAPYEATVTESKEFTDTVTGQQREVDIVIETKVGAHPFVIGIECRDRKRPADAPWIEGIASKHRDIGTHKTVVVSKSGYYKPALKKAEQLKIEALTLQEAGESDWVGRTTELANFEGTTVEQARVKCEDVRLQVLPPSPPPYPPPPKFGSEVDTIVYDAAGNAMRNIKQVVDSVIHTDTNFVAHLAELAVPNTDVPFDFTIFALDDLYYVFDEAGTRHRLAQIVLEGECHLAVPTLTQDRMNYGSIPVLYEAGELMGQPIQVIWTLQDGKLSGSISFGEPKPPESKNP
jgi:hypothetical protein